MWLGCTYLNPSDHATPLDLALSHPSSLAGGLCNRGFPTVLAPPWPHPDSQGAVVLQPRPSAGLASDITSESRSAGEKLVKKEKRWAYGERRKW